MADQKVSYDPMLQSDEEIELLKQGKGLDDQKHLDFGDDDIVTVRNILDRPFRFKFRGGLYELDAGKAQEMPGFMAWHYLKKFADYYYRQVKKQPEKARIKHYKRNDPLFRELIAVETKVPTPVNESERGKVIKLEGNAHLPDDIKDDFESTGEDQVLATRELKPDKPISDAEFDRGTTEQDKAIDEANEAPKAEFPDAQKSSKKAKTAKK